MLIFPCNFLNNYSLTLYSYISFSKNLSKKGSKLMREGHVGQEVANQYCCNYPPHLLDTQPECQGLFLAARGT